jgi:putative tryptophan/tyrosine transport system substrate-binding protein
VPAEPRHGCQRRHKLRPHVFRLLALAIAWLLSACASADEASVWLALSELGGPYAEAANALRVDLAQPGPRHVDVRVGSWQDLRETPGKPPQLIVTVGAAAYRGVIEEAQRGGVLAGVPVLAILLPRASYESMAPKARAPTSAIFLDQPLGRYLDLLRLTMPDRRRIGVLLGPDSSSLATTLTRAAAARGMPLVTAKVSGDDDLYSGLRSVLGDAEVLLALPDARVFNAGSLQNILIATYRQRVPLVAFAPGYVRAGATLALYSSPSQVADQAAGVVRAFVGGRPLPAPQAASDFSVAVNDRVARSLGLTFDDSSDLAEQLRRQEAQR